MFKGTVSSTVRLSRGLSPGAVLKISECIFLPENFGLQSQQHHISAVGNIPYISSTLNGIFFSYVIPTTLTTNTPDLSPQRRILYIRWRKVRNKLVSRLCSLVPIEQLMQFFVVFVTFFNLILFYVCLLCGLLFFLCVCCFLWGQNTINEFALNSS